jgi:anti-sigma B factor antagonist
MGEQNRNVCQATARTVRRGGVVVTTVAGEVDIDSGDLILHELTTQLARAPAAVVVDLSSVTFFGAAGVNLLVQMREQADRRDVAFAVVAGQRAVLRPLRATDTDRALHCVPTLPEAMAAVRPHRPVTTESNIVRHAV